MPNEKKEDHTFVIRVWREKGNGEFIWRGSITNVQSGEKKHFQSLPDLAELIARAVEAGLGREGGASRMED